MDVPAATVAAEVEEGFRSSDGGVRGKASSSRDGQASSDKIGSSPEASPASGEIVNVPRVGEDDANGYKIETIFYSTRQFVIYQADGQVRYALPANYETAKVLRRRVADLGGLRSSIEDLRAESYLSSVE